MDMPSRCMRCGKEGYLHRIWLAVKGEYAWICEAHCYHEWGKIFEDKLQRHPKYPNIDREFYREFMKFLNGGIFLQSLERVC